MEKIFIILNGIRLFPLWILIKIRLALGDTYLKLLLEDLNKAGKSFFVLLYYRPEYKVLCYHRIGRISKLVAWICGDYSLCIPHRKKLHIGGGLTLAHPQNSFLCAKSIGSYLHIKHNVTIGLGKGGVPIIGNNVYVGCGACILGGITVGDNVKIGAGCVVVHDVPSDCTVIGNPAYIVKLKGKKVCIKL